MGGELISVLMAVKTGAEFAPEAVASVMAQRNVAWELLIGVNGHPPRSDVFCRLANHLPEWRKCGLVELIDLPDCTNKPQALNRLRERAAGDWVAVLDADDLWLPEKLERQLPLVRSGFDVVGTAAERFGDQHGPLAIKTGLIGFADLLECNHVVNSSAVLRRGLARWPDTDGLDDYPLWLDLARRGKRIFVLPDVLTRLRSHQGQHFAGRIDDSQAIRAAYRALGSGGRSQGAG